jgi:hypothetical protein
LIYIYSGPVSLRHGVYDDTEMLVPEGRALHEQDLGGFDYFVDALGAFEGFVL